MATKSKLGPVSPEERRAYRASIANDRAWRRPELKTTQVVWSLLEDTPPVPLDDVLPKRRSRGALSAEEYDLDVQIAKQSLVVALDCAITVGDRGAMLTKNTLFDALAARWSRRYHRAQRRGATTSYDMRVETVTRALRELLLAGIRFDTLWGKILTGTWSRSGINPLFSVSRIQGKGHALGYRVDVIASDTLQLFEAAVEADRHYRRRQQKCPLLLAEDWRPRRRRVRQHVCAERPYNVVNLGKKSERVLSILEGARVQFKVETFREDYETLKAYLDGGHRPSVRSQWPNYRKLKGFVASYRRLYRHTENIPVEFFDVGGSAVPIPRTAWIRSRFFRASNRRYHAAHLWPERVHKEFRARWFSVGLDLPAYHWAPEDLGGDMKNIPTIPADYVERDVVTSQIQTLAVFLGLKELEALAVSERPTLKEWLADRIWTQHRESGERLLTDGYMGADDTRLIAFAKAHLVRFYGGDLGKIIRKCGRNPEQYGPGWRTPRGLWAAPTIKPGTKTVRLTKSGVDEAIDRALEFFLNLPEWTNTLEEFLAACRTLAEKRPDGVVFRDPLDGAEIRWNHAQRGVVHVGHEEIDVHPAGANTKLGFFPAPAGTVDPTALARYVTPCLTHTLDAFFSSLVLEGLEAAGIGGVVALHDAWLVPEIVPDPGDPTALLAGGAVLRRVIEAAGEPWLLGLGCIYDQLVSDLGDDKTFGPFVREIRDRWQKRRDAVQWPKFLSR